EISLCIIMLIFSVNKGREIFACILLEALAVCQCKGGYQSALQSLKLIVSMIIVITTTVLTQAD
uniref:Uncharacterized protein n=1 Tax=Amphimedon queenslandica TaxID=400682 RepID=A0A1X7UHU2_AMPQE